jgi:cell division protein FtsI (penicillin-binding protein 3)
MKVKNSRLIVIFLFLLAGWSLVILRAAQLQLLPNDRLAELRKREYRTMVELPARRGIISDRNGKELAGSVPSYSVFADPREIERPKQFSKIVARHLGYGWQNIYSKINDADKRFVWLKRHLSKDADEEMKGLHLRGLGSVEESLRVYPNENFLSQTLGFVGEEGKGLEGLELKYDSILKGENRKIKIEKDARGRPLLEDGRIFSDIPAGSDLQLTIDSDLQYQLEKDLLDAVHLHLAEAAMGIVLDAQTSEILAIANAPSYDPNRPRDFSQENLRNRVVTDAYEPGSTVKAILIAGSLHDGVTKPNKNYFCENGEFKVDDRVIHEADAHHRFGWLSTSEILMHSSNIGAAKIAFELGDKKVRQIFSDFGLGEHSGVDLPGESRGILQPLPWRNHLLANIAFGHGLTATPLQIASAYAAIANGGVLRTPTILRSTINTETNERTEFTGKEIRRVLTPEQAATMRIMLNAVTSPQGTGFAARVPGFPVAGKTGTAQKIEVGHGYAKGEYISSFAGFIPANDPKYVIYVAIDNPRNQYYGSEVAAPLFAKIAGYAVRQAGLPPVLLTEKNLVRAKPTAAEEATTVRDHSIATIREMAKVMSDEDQNKTPDLSGLTLREVLNRVRGTPIRVETSGRGVVSMTFPPAGEPLPPNKKIRVYLGQ